MTRVRNLSAWAGLLTYHAEGDVLDLADEVAAARIAAGLAEPIVEDDAPPAPPKRGPGRPPKGS